jgi:hypothetical protein
MIWAFPRPPEVAGVGSPPCYPLVGLIGSSAKTRLVPDETGGFFSFSRHTPSPLTQSQNSKDKPKRGG